MEPLLVPLCADFWSPALSCGYSQVHCFTCPNVHMILGHVTVAVHVEGQPKSTTITDHVLPRFHQGSPSLLGRSVLGCQKVPLKVRPRFREGSSKVPPRCRQGSRFSKFCGVSGFLRALAKGSAEGSTKVSLRLF